MNVPDFETIMLSLLRRIEDGEEHRFSELVDVLADDFDLTEEERNAMQPSGRSRIFYNRSGWARNYLKNAGLVEDPRRGYVNITEKGKKVLASKPSKVDVEYLMRFPAFVDFKTGKGNVSKDGSADEEKTPDDLIEEGFSLIESDLKKELLRKTLSASPYFFEQLVVNLLSAMGYGVGRVTAKSNDGGVDGVINQDSLGLEQIFVQAKRFNQATAVSASMLRDFVGALVLKGVAKGIFITTSRFPQNADDILRGASQKIILIDGDRLLDLMIKYSVGAETERTYEIKRIDADFFVEE